MSDPIPVSHLSDAELLAALDGELTSADAERVERHLEACWTCRTERDRVEAAIGDVVRYTRRRMSVLPEPSAGGRAKIIAHLHEHARHMAPAPWWKRASAAHRIVASLWSVPAVRMAAVAVAIALVVWPFVRTDRLSASELLTQARQAELQSLSRVVEPVVYQRVQIRAGNRTLVRTTYRDTTGNRLAERIEASTSAGPASAGADVSAASASIRRSLETAGRDWAGLLSATEYDAWRRRISVAKENVSEARGTLAVTTTPAGGAIAESTLTLRVNDYHPVSEAIRMRDESQFEITELAHEVLTLSALQPSIFGPVPAVTPDVTVAEPAPRAPVAAEALEDSELEIRLALREIDADLVQGIQLRRTSRRVELRGRLDTATQTLIRSRLAAVPYAAVRTVPVDVPKEGTAAERPLAVGLVSWRLRTFGDAATGELPLRDIFVLAERIRLRAEAYHAVAQRYEVTSAGQLSDAAAHKLDALVRAHHHELVSDIDSLDRELAVLLGWTPRRLLEEDIRADWRGQAAASSVAARDLLEHVRAVIGTPDIPLGEIGGAHEAPEISRVRRVLTDLWKLFERSSSR